MTAVYYTQGQNHSFHIEQEELNAGKEEINWDHYKKSIKEIQKMK